MKNENVSSGILGVPVIFVQAAWGVGVFRKVRFSGQGFAIFLRRAIAFWAGVVFLGGVPFNAVAKNEAPAKAANEVVAGDKNKVIAQAPSLPPAFAAKGFKVLAHRLDPKTQLHIWAVMHSNGTKTILYSTPNNELFFTGALWDGQSGANISDIYYESLSELSTEGALLPTHSPAAQISAPQAVPAKQQSSAPPQIPAAILRLSQLKGIRDGADGVPLYRTLFVFFDPRCPYCKQFFEATRNRPELKDKAIVWLPVIVLGNNPKGEALVAEIMQSGQPAKTLQSVFAGSVSGSVKPDESTVKALRENEAIFFTAFQGNPGAGQASVPVAFFVDKAGQAQMVPNPYDYFSKILAEMF